jgi:two-component system, NtrC family, sensor histidine kinase HydH
MKKYLLFLSIIIISALHYLTPVMLHNFHAIYQRLYYLPIILCAYKFGFRWGLTAAIFSAIVYIPHIFLQWASMPMEMFTQYIEIIMFLVIGSLVGILSDIQKAQLKQIAQANERMNRMDKMSLLGQLAAGLAHEIRNPLGSLIGSDEILAESLGKAHPKYEFIEILQKEHRRLRDKLNEFLSFARPTPACIIPNNLNAIVKATVNLAEKQTIKSGCSLVLDLDDKLRDIPIDADRMKQILLNLLINSCQAMPNGGTITVCTWPEKESVCLSINDQGAGIDKKIISRIFEPFFTTKNDGTGLGLAIVKQLIEEMNGKIDVQSSQQGSQFTIRIPGE